MTSTTRTLAAIALLCTSRTSAANPIPCCVLSVHCNELKSLLAIRLTVTKQCLLPRDAGLALGSILLRKDDQPLADPQWILFSDEKDRLVVGADLQCSALDGRHKYEVDATSIAKACRLSAYVGQLPQDCGITADQNVVADLRATTKSEGCSLSPSIALPSWLLLVLLFLTVRRLSTRRRPTMPRR